MPNEAEVAAAMERWRAKDYKHTAKSMAYFAWSQQKWDDMETLADYAIANRRRGRQKDVIMAEHAWHLIVAKGEDSPGHSLDSVSWCIRCGMVRHDYSHNGGQTSPNYPRYFIPKVGPTIHEQECVK